MSATAVRDVASVFGTQSVVLEGSLPSADVDTGFSGMPSARFAGFIKKMAVILDDATVLDDRKSLLSRLFFRFAAPGTRREPHRFGAFGSRLPDVTDDRFGATKDHHEIHGAGNLVEARVSWQSRDPRAVRTHRNHIVALF